MLEGNSQNDSEECKTPSAKRKEEDADLPDITSTFKKLCTSIKMEKGKGRVTLHKKNVFHFMLVFFNFLILVFALLYSETIISFPIYLFYLFYQESPSPTVIPEPDFGGLFSRFNICIFLISTITINFI